MISFRVKSILYFRNSLLKTACYSTSNGNKLQWIPFSHSKQGTFVQKSPKLKNRYLEDAPLTNYLQKHIPQQILNEINDDLTKFGERVITDIHELGRQCELNPPKLIQQNAWGVRIDEIWTCDAWKKMHAICAEEGIVAIGYERKYSEWSRLYQIAKLYLYGPSSGLYSCPIAMTDGAAKTIEMLEYKNCKRFQTAFFNLISRNSQNFWTSGQWMTEKKGGSDVAGGTETLAISQGNDCYKLFGYKWFTSAVDSNMTFTLARIADKNGNVIQGTHGLTLFYVETKQNGNLNNIQIIRLKDKLGTRQLPTAELLLDGTVAFKMSEEGRGIAAISHMLTITRIHNAVSSVSAMRYILSLARDYANRRIVFGKKLAEHPLHIQTLARMDLEIRGSLLLLFEIVKWLGKQECGKATDQELLLFRLLNPILKLYTAKQAITVISEGLEAFGGQGYMEDTGLPSVFRDAQVLPIWEGTTNVLSLDVLRSISKLGIDVLHAFCSDVKSRLKTTSENLMEAKTKVETSLENVTDFIRNNPDKLQIAARDLSYSIARIYIGALLIENACDLNANNQDKVAAFRWCCGQDLSSVSTYHKLKFYDSDAINNEKDLVFDLYND